MFSVLAAISTGGLYVPAVCIVFLRRLYFLAASSKPVLFNRPLTGWPILDPSFSIAAFCPLPPFEQGYQRLRRALRPLAVNPRPILESLYHKRQP